MEWFVDITNRSNPEIPREIVNSIQEVINDSSPGMAVDSIRNEVRELRQIFASSRHATAGLPDLVVNLSAQVKNNSVIVQIHPGDKARYRDSVISLF